MKGTSKPAGKRGAGQSPAPSVSQSAWPQRLKDLKRFKKKHGHCKVPGHYSPNRSLGIWVSNLRSRKKAGKLTEKWIRCLEELGFCWALRNRSVFRLDWDVMLAALAAFAERYGHCNVPCKWPEDLQLSWYVKSLRRKKRQSKLDQRQIAQLNRLGIVWEPTSKPSWSEMYAALAEYKRVHGDCNAPFDWSETPYLGIWISKQRQARKANCLELDRIKQLDKLGFAWDYLEFKWESQYAALVKFRKEYGHCRVSTLSKTHSVLANWVRTQRLRKKQDKLSAERFRRLELLGFTWEIPLGRFRPIENVPKTGASGNLSRSRPRSG
ncbi:MAG: helicase associated domain-containing protein [Planctomycetota bacterium]